jgi:hypothetical protein
VGISLNVPIGLKEWVGSGLYGAQVDWNHPQFVYILKPLGAFMIALGIMAGIAARNPLRNRAIIYGFAILFIIRGLQRIVFLEEIQAAFGIGGSRHLSTMVFMFLSAALLLALLYFADKEPEPERRAVRT